MPPNATRGRPPFAWATLLTLALATVSFAQGADPPDSGYRDLLREAPAAPAQTHPIHEVPFGPPLERVPAGPPSGHCRVGVNGQRNGRVPFTLGAAEWRRAASAPHDSGPRAVLGLGQRVLLVEEETWTLYDEGLSRVARGRLTGEVALDPVRELFYASEAAGLLGAHRLADGARAFAVPTSLGSDSTVRFLAAQGDSIVLAGSELGEGGRARSLIEAIALGPTREPDGAGLLAAAGPAGLLRRPSLQLRVAQRGAGLVLASDGGLAWTDGQLAIRSLARGGLLPLQLSVDAAGAHLLVQAGPRVEYWLITEQGQRRARVPLPIERPVGPPVVGYDRRVRILGRRRAACVEGARLLWTRDGKRPAGAIVTADDQLLVAEGEQLLAVDPAGRARVLVRLPGARLLTAPCLLAPDRLLVASNAELLLFRPK